MLNIPQFSTAMQFPPKEINSYRQYAGPYRPSLRHLASGLNTKKKLTYHPEIVGC
jgi:hypothetical protein